MNSFFKAIEYIQDINLKIFLSKLIRRLFYKSQSKLAWKINEYNENNIERYLETEFNKSTFSLEKEYEFANKNVPKDPIWIMWWQGEEKAPEVVKTCINSARKNSNNHNVIVITEKNFCDYFKLPDFIIEKFNKGYISRTHLSDMIRLNLLYLYGGLWLDATVYVTHPISNDLFTKNFYSCNFGINTKDPSHGRWTTFLMFGRKKNSLFKKVLEYHYKYWINHNVIVDYIMFDYIINYIAKHDEECYNQINSVPKNNVNVFELFKILNSSANNWNFKKLDENTIFYKLSYKHKLMKEVNGEKTIYGKIVEEYL